MVLLILSSQQFEFMKKNRIRTNQKANQRSPSSSYGSFSDLITNSQKNITQNSGIPSQSRSINSRITTQTQDQDLFILEDLAGEESTTVFISQEEEKVIQQILQISRKGKINQENAFEIPIKVLDPTHFNTSKNRFWKFASDLLRASMNIYDKRVENISLGVNRIHGGLGRVDNANIHQESIQQLQQRQQKEKLQNRNYLLNMRIQELNQNHSFDLQLIGQDTLENPVKLNIIKTQNQFITDPLFYKKLKMFDESSPKSLLLNLFNLSDNLQVRIFDQLNPNIVPYKQSQNVFDSKLQHEWRNSNFILDNLNLFDDIASFRQKQTKRQSNLQSIIPSESIRIQDNILDFFDQVRENENIQFHDIAKNQENHHHSQLNFDTYNEVNDERDKMSQVFCYSQKTPLVAHKFYEYSSNYEQNGSYSVLTPWQLEFKKSVLKKKTIKRQNRPKSNNRQPLGIDDEELIDFNEKVRQTKKLILKCEKNDQILTKKKVENYEEKKVNSISMHVYQEYHNKKFRQREQLNRSYNKSQQDLQFKNKMQFPHEETNYYQEQTKFFQNNSMEQKGFQKNSDRGLNSPIENAFIWQHESSQIMGLNSKNKYFNIRQLKNLVMHQFHHHHRQVALSELQFDISPQSILIAFLHLANEKQLQITTNGMESDVILHFNDKSLFKHQQFH